MLKRFGIWLPALFCLLPLTAVPQLVVTDYQQPTLFNGQEIVLINKGDDLAWREPGWDDSNWQVTSLPRAWADIYPDYNGICWYRLHIRLPEQLPAGSLGLSLGVITDADQTFFNGHLIGGAGTVLNEQDSAYDKIRIYQLPQCYLLPGQDNVLALRIRGVFSYSNGPFMGNLKIDHYSSLLKEFYLREIFDLVFVVIYLVVAVYFLLFFIRRSEDKENLFFSLFCFAITLYFFLRTQLKYLLGFSFFWSKKLEYLTLAWLVYLLMEFLIYYFRKKHNWLHFVFLGLTTLFFGLILFTGSYRFWDNLNQYFMSPSWLIGVVVGFYILISKLKTELDARLMFFTLIILLCTMINDILINMVLYDFIRLSNYGFLFFVGGIAAILSNRFVRLHREVADLNINLEQKVVERTDELNHTVLQLKAAKTETDNILRNVQEGIFLIDDGLVIGHNYSKTLENIFETAELGGRSFPELLEDLLPPDTVKQTTDFIRLLLTRTIAAKRMHLLNPLEEVSLRFSASGGFKEKYLNFAFTRISEQEDKKFILGTVRDITEKKKLTLQVKVTKENAEKESQLLMNIIQLNPMLLKNFLQESQLEIRHMEVLLKKAQFSEELRGLLKDVYASVHAIKGNAGMLNIQLLAELTHTFEAQIKYLYEKQQVTAVDLIDLPYGVVKIKEVLGRVQQIIERITLFKDSFGRSVLSAQEYLVEAMKNLTERVAEREHKKVNLDFSLFVLPEKEKIDNLALKKILLQLVKNAVVHGIELPAERQAAGKPEAGLIILKSKLTQQELIISVSDDGGKIDPQRIRQAALHSGKFTESQLAGYDEDKLARLIFQTGLSTREELTIDAGRGIGLDVVKQTVKEMRGKIGLAFSTGKFTRFRLTIPLGP